MLVLLRLPQGVTLLDTRNFIETDGAVVMGEGKDGLQGLLREGFSFACLKFRLVDLQLALPSLAIAETFDGLVSIMREIF